MSTVVHVTYLGVLLVHGLLGLTLVQAQRLASSFK